VAQRKQHLPEQLALRKLITDTQCVTVHAAFVAVVVAFAAGWLMRRWRGSENSVRITRRAADVASKAAWRSRLWFAGAAFLVWCLAYVWIHKH
jgi:uncharacterized protein YndB with AHSA1/START domain